MDHVRTRTGGRSARVRDRIFGAVKAALESGDLEALAVERIAETAGVHRSTVYRRWLSSAGLVADLLISLTPVQPPLPDSGDLARDLRAVARRVASTITSPWVNTTLRLTAASDDPDLLAAATAYWSHILDHTATVVRRAQTRGQATTDIDAVDAVESLLGPIYLRVLVTRSPITTRDITSLADRTTRMLRPEDAPGAAPRHHAKVLDRSINRGGIMVTRLNPYLSFNGTARQAMEFYAGVFGGTLTVNAYGEFGATDSPDADRVMHAVLETDAGYTIMAGDMPSDQDYQPMAGISVSLSGDDADLLHGYWNKLSAAGTATMPLEKQVWGDEFGMCVDQFGTSWMVNISQPTEN